MHTVLHVLPPTLLYKSQARKINQNQHNYHNNISYK